MAKNFDIFNLGQFSVLPSIVIPSLTGISKELNPDETIHVSGDETSWLCKLFNASPYLIHSWTKSNKPFLFGSFNVLIASFAHVAHPIGSLLSGPVCDKIGRRKSFMVVSIPLLISWIMLGFSQSFPIVCLAFLVLGLCMGLNETPSITYVEYHSAIESESIFPIASLAI